MPSPLDVLQRALRAARLPEEHSAPLPPFLDACDALAAESLASRGITVACASGCSHCCHQYVSTVPAEVFAIVHHVRAHFTPAALAALMTRIDQHLAKVSPLTFDQRSRQSIVCPFLVAGRCSVYPARPASCRSYHSLDRHYCARYEENPAALQPDDRPLDPAVEDLWVEFITQSDACYQALGYPHHEGELVSTFHAAMTFALPEAHWRQKIPPLPQPPPALTAQPPM